MKRTASVEFQCLHPSEWHTSCLDIHLHNIKEHPHTFHNTQTPSATPTHRQFQHPNTTPHHPHTISPQNPHTHSLSPTPSVPYTARLAITFPPRPPHNKSRTQNFSPATPRHSCAVSVHKRAATNTQHITQRPGHCTVFSPPAIAIACYRALSMPPPGSA